MLLPMRWASWPRRVYLLRAGERQEVWIWRWAVVLFVAPASRQAGAPLTREVTAAPGNSSGAGPANTIPASTLEEGHVAAFVAYYYIRLHGLDDQDLSSPEKDVFSKCRTSAAR